MIVELHACKGRVDHIENTYNQTHQMPALVKDEGMTSDRRSEGCNML